MWHFSTILCLKLQLLARLAMMFSRTEHQVRAPNQTIYLHLSYLVIAEYLPVVPALLRFRRITRLPRYRLISRRSTPARPPSYRPAFPEPFTGPHGPHGLRIWRDGRQQHYYDGRRRLAGRHCKHWIRWELVGSSDEKCIRKTKFYRVISYYRNLTPNILLRSVQWFRKVEAESCTPGGLPAIFDRQFRSFMPFLLSDYRIVRFLLVQH